MPDMPERASMVWPTPIEDSSALGAVDRHVSGRLPESVRKALIKAASTGEAGSLERRAAIDNVIFHARLRHPDFFKLEGGVNVSIGCD